MRKTYASWEGRAIHSRMATKSCWCLRLPAARFRQASVQGAIGRRPPFSLLREPVGGESIPHSSGQAVARGSSLYIRSTSSYNLTNWLIKCEFKSGYGSSVPAPSFDFEDGHSRSTGSESGCH